MSSPPLQCHEEKDPTASSSCVHERIPERASRVLMHDWRATSHNKSSSLLDPSITEMQPASPPEIIRPVREDDDQVVVGIELPLPPEQRIATTVSSSEGNDVHQCTKKKDVRADPCSSSSNLQLLIENDPNHQLHHAAAAASHCAPKISICVRPSLEACVRTWGTNGDAAAAGRPPFYPCGPPWLRCPKRFADDLLEAGMGIIVEQLVAGFVLQREINFRWRVLSHYAYADLLSPDTQVLYAEEHQRRYRKFGWELNLSRGAYTKSEVMAKRYDNCEPIDGWIPPREIRNLPPVASCGECHREIPLADPPECICGEVYCSTECHAAAWATHEAICRRAEADCPLALELTRKSWVFSIFSGVVEVTDIAAVVPWKAAVHWVPRPCQRDVQLDARQAVNGGRPFSADQWHSELQFYRQHEREAVTSRSKAFEVELALCGSNVAARAAVLRLILVDDLWSLLFYASYHETDTVGRLVFKISMLQYYLEKASLFWGVLEDDDEQQCRNWIKIPREAISAHYERAIQRGLRVPLKTVLEAASCGCGGGGGCESHTTAS